MNVALQWFVGIAVILSIPGFFVALFQVIALGNESRIAGILSLLIIFGPVLIIAGAYGHPWCYYVGASVEYVGWIGSILLWRHVIS